MFEILCLLFLKHYFADFVWQTERMVREKAHYGQIHGLYHSGLHALLTFAIVSFFTFPVFAFTLAFIDFLFHYHIDWFKMNYGERDITKKEFWHHLGADQLAHAITYIIIVKFLWIIGV
jgi:hypothetical protein